MSRLCKKLFPFTVFLIVICLAFTGFSQATETSSRAVDDKSWKRLTNDPAFRYRYEKETVPLPKESNAGNVLSDLFKSFFEFFTSPMGRFIVWGFFFLIIGYALFRIYTGNKTFLFSKKAKQPAEQTQTPEEELTGTNWENLLQQAVATGDLRMAVRYSYMLLLLKFQERHLIEFRADKTNYEYLQEIGNPEIRAPFRKMTRHYEYAWYGNFSVSQVLFTEYMGIFQQLKNRLH